MRRCIVATLAALFVLVGSGVGVLYTQGYRAYIVHTGSMLPTLKLGTVIIDRPDVHPRVGQIVSVEPRPGEVVTHRVSSIYQGHIKTRGDANNGDDYWTLDRNQVLGSPALTVPYVGYFVVFLRQPSGALALASLALALALAWSLFFGEEPVVDIRAPSDAVSPDSRSGKTVARSKSSAATVG
jgi:signal peptidase